MLRLIVSISNRQNLLSNTQFTYKRISTSKGPIRLNSKHLYLIHTYVNNIRHSMRNCAYDIRKLFHLRTRHMEESVQLFSVPLLQPCLAVHQALNVKRIKDNLRGVTLVRFIATTSREALQIDTWPLFKRIDEGIGPSSYGNFNLLLRRLLKKKKSRKESWESYRVEESRFLI